MNIPYIKMNGLGNDFVVIDQRHMNYGLSSSDVMSISNRQTGIGCDQLILLEKPTAKGADITMRIINASGGEVEACGNASRCVAGLMMKETSKDVITIDTKGGRIIAQNTAGQNDWITIDMGEPKFDWQDIPLSEEFHDTRLIELAIGPYDAPVLHSPSVVNVGNPHAVFFVDKSVDDFELDKFGPLLEMHPMFPEGANISIANVMSDDFIKARVWERGAGLTLACGTGACAIAICAMRKNLVAKNTQVELPGGILRIEWLENNHILMSGAWSDDGKGIIHESLIHG